ncbi:FtsB family cell division protein [Heyndrickxia acidiproducens]|uniref:FtsB family cell division protein n=1 Tax=Heyndrickxia acidiproducens TaxID=1121084 RepID=UPI00036D723B|nr:septum formation initiator family protein [Heyndrickxia acidiproducens]
MEHKIASMDNAYTKQKIVKEKIIARRRKLLVRRLTLFTAVAVVISYILVATLISRNEQLAAKQQQKAGLEQKVKEIDKQQALLKGEIVKLKDNDYIAKLARSEYFLSEKGEIIFNIPNSKKNAEEGDVSY